MVGKDFTKQAWRGIITIGLFIKCLHETRPYEINKGETYNLYKKYLSKIDEPLQSRNGTMPEFLSGMRKSFSEIPKSSDKRPLIGIIGEIFVRHNKFANENIIRKVEALGGEVWLAPVEEWVYYVNLMGLRKSLLRFRKSGFSMENTKDIMSMIITRYVQNKIEHEFSRPFEGYLRTCA
jgi:predicted nucleotide-binding protein (sugar kinase/HSP70/actin superfamily)